MRAIPSCPFCQAVTVKLVLDGDHFLTNLDYFHCATCSYRWRTPKLDDTPAAVRGDGSAPASSRIESFVSIPEGVRLRSSQ